MDKAKPQLYQFWFSDMKLCSVFRNEIKFSYKILVLYFKMVIIMKQNIKRH